LAGNYREIYQSKSILMNLEHQSLSINTQRLPKITQKNNAERIRFRELHQQAIVGWKDRGGHFIN
jgi:hypothetical protein